MTADAVPVPPDMAEETVATESDEEVLEAEEVLSRTSASASAHSATHALSATATSSSNQAQSTASSSRASASLPKLSLRYMVPIR